MVGLKIASIILPFIGFAFCGSKTARQNPSWPTSYVALGDSFAAGIGAGQYVNRADSEVKRCKRFDGSYPSQAKKLLPNVDDAHFTFVACSGDVLAGIDAQVQKLGGQKAQVITLSISGNDFKFGDVVRGCVYNYGSVSDSGKDSDCENALAQATQKVNDGNIWALYKAKVTDILNGVAIQGQSVLVITGYAKFFGQPSEGDACSNARFPIPVVGVKGNLLHTQVRTQMNTLVDTVNRRISSEIVGVDPSRIKFVDIDAQFEGHRFCDNGKTDGANDPDVWFISLTTTLQETSFVPDGNSELERDWDAWAQGLPDDGNILPGKLRQSSCFHPKTAGHAETAKNVQNTVESWGNENGHAPAPPPQQCYPTDAGDIPGKIVAVTSPNQVVDPNGLLYMIRAVLCSNSCNVPAGIDPRAAAVVSGANGRCDISLGVQGGSEAYAVRDRSISGNDQIQKCWDVLESIITTCVNNGAKHGWQNGVDPTPAFYQTGYRKLNDPGASHPAISGDHLLEKDLSDFHSICGDGNGDCQKNGCAGVWYICSAGTYKGCNCAIDSRFSQLPPPDHKLQCHTDCCNTVANQWYTNDWCAANCGAISSQYC